MTVSASLSASSLKRLRTAPPHRFGAASCEMQTIRGEWEDEGQIYRDELVRVFVDIEDTEENRQFFREFRNRLKTRFRQLAIWLTSHPIDIE